MKIRKLLSVLLVMILVVAVLPIEALAVDSADDAAWKAVNAEVAAFEAEPVEDDALSDQFEGVSLFNVGDHEYDETEPNDDYYDAGLIENDYTVYGYLTWCDLDTFVFQLTETSTVQILVGATRSGMNFLVQDYYEEAVAVPNYTEYDGGLYFDGYVGVLPAGTYFVTLLDMDADSYYYYAYPEMDYILYYEVAPVAPDTSDSYGGVCGDNLTWTLEDGVLTISGTGDMYDYGLWETPWIQAIGMDNWDYITEVVIEDGATSIGSCAFSRLQISWIDIPDTVTHIGTEAFSFSGLVNLVIPASVTEIGEAAFSDTYALEIITFMGNAPAFAGESAFATSSAHIIRFYGNASSFSEYAFYGVEATCYYPASNKTWTADVRQNYGGTLTWVGEQSVIRIYGNDRYATAFKAADALKENLGVQKFENIVVACGTDFADALSGSYLANQKNAPILLVRNNKNTMNSVKDYIKKNLVSGGTVYLLGGKNAIPVAMESGLDGFTVKRLAGNTRYDTNLEILKEAGVGDKDILVCTGKEFADGLSASAVNKPILLVKDNLNTAQKNFLSGLSGNKIYVIGGTNAVSAKTETALGAYGSVTRISGATRYDTSVNIAKEFFPNASSVVLAYGQNFPDGLSAGSLACSMDAPLILTSTSKPNQAVAYATAAGIKSGAVLGGPGLISDKVVKRIFSMGTNDLIIVK